MLAAAPAPAPTAVPLAAMTAPALVPVPAPTQLVMKARAQRQVWNIRKQLWVDVEAPARSLLTGRSFEELWLEAREKAATSARRQQREWLHRATMTAPMHRSMCPWHGGMFVQ